VRAPQQAAERSPAATGNPAARRVEKSSAAFRTISEVAQDLDVPQHVLRFWETRFTQIRPLKRGGGRRYYRPEDVALLRLIRELLYAEGYTIKGVQKLMREGALKQRLAQLEAEQVAPPEPVAISGAPADAPMRERLQAILTELESLRDRLRSALA
jgi:DNA-binding transcriptional MerR regulator